MDDDNVFYLRPTPRHASTKLINSLWDYATSLMKQQAVNAETAFIDLKRRYKIKVERRPSLFRLPEYSAIDELTFDPDPISRWHIIGVGESESDAKLDLLEKLNAERP
jgi:hypothetical protein